MSDFSIEFYKREMNDFRKMFSQAFDLIRGRECMVEGYDEPGVIIDCFPDGVTVNLDNDGFIRVDSSRITIN